MTASRVSRVFTPFRLWIGAFTVTLGVGAIPTYGETSTTILIIIALRWAYGRYLVRHRGNDEILNDNDDRSIANGDASTDDDGSTATDSSGTNNMKDDDTTSSRGTLNESIFSDDKESHPYYEDLPWSGHPPLEINGNGRCLPSILLWDDPTLKIDLIEPISRVDSVESVASESCLKKTPEVDVTPANAPSPHPSLRRKRKKKNRRLYFLDNLKVFLIFLLVSFHVACAFGASDMFYFTIGDYSNGFQQAAGVVLGLLQTFGIALFFFVTGYLAPAGYERHGREAFMLKRAGNLLVPALVGCVLVVPGCVIIGQAMGGLSIFAFPHPGHFWVSFWLLLLTWMYSSLYDSTRKLPFSSSEIPSTPIRMLAGFGICGAAMFAMVLVYQVAGGNSFFGSMPLTIGSLLSYVLMFYIGVVGYRNSWLERPIRDQLDISIGVLRLIVLCEAILLVCLFPIAPSFANEIQFHSASESVYALGAFLVAGVFCLDMSIVVLDLFQQHADFEHPVMKGLLDSAHIVYVIHPLVISLLCWGFVAFYNYFIGQYGVPSIDFQRSDFYYYFHEYAISKTVFIGPSNGAVTIFMGFQCILILTHVFVWPLARLIRKYCSGQKRKLNVVILTLLPSPAF